MNSGIPLETVSVSVPVVMADPPGPRPPPVRRSRASFCPSPEGPPPAVRSGSCVLRRGQGFRHGLELLQQLLVAPVGVGQPFAVQVHQLAEPLYLGLEGEVLCPGVASCVLTGRREVTIRVSGGVFIGVFDYVIHEDPDGMPKAVLLRFGGKLAPLDHSVKSCLGYV